MITLICGHSRAGKTTYSERYDGICPVLHFDEIRSHEKINSVVGSVTGDIVVEGIYYERHEREELLKAYKGKGSRCIFLDTPIEVRRKRMRWNIRDFPFPCPTKDEGWDEIIVVRYEEE